MRREIITWSLVGAALLSGFGITVAILNSTLYSAGGFVHSYLDSLARHDADGALELSGPSAAGGGSTELLVTDAMGELSDIQQVSDVANEDGTHTVTYTYVAAGEPGRTTFEVEHTGAKFGIFTTWSFVTRPLGVIYMTVLHTDDFTANGVALVTPAQNDPAPYLVFTPGNYEFTHDSTFLEAKPVDVLADEPGAGVPAALSATANARFIRDVQKEIDDYLDTCAEQEVLQPTGCPFGQLISNRIASTPAWNIAEYPVIAIKGGDKANEWVVPPTAGAAHLTVDVRSLFDGSVTTFDEDVPFGVSYIITFVAEDELLLTAQY